MKVNPLITKKTILYTTNQTKPPNIYPSQAEMGVIKKQLTTTPKQKLGGSSREPPSPYWGGNRKP